MIRATNQLRQLLFVLFTILTFGLTAQSTFTVTNTNDTGAGSLRQAITDANASSGADAIDMTNISGTILLESALPQINGDLTLNGPGEELLSISGQDLYRPFFINAGTVNLNNISIINGLAKGGDGGTNYSGGGGGAGMGGGLIANSNVDLTLEHITFSDNQARGGKGGGAPNFANQARPGSAGGSGPFHGSTPPSGRNGAFGSGGSSGTILLVPEDGGNYTGGNGGYGAGGGGGGSSAYSSNSGFILEYTGGTGGKFGGNGGRMTGQNYDGGKEGGGGAGLGGAVFSRANSITLKNVSFINNSALGGETYTTESFLNNYTIITSRGKGKGGALFIYSEQGNVPNYSIDGMALSGNDAQDAMATDTDNEDVYLEEGLSFVDNTIFALSKTSPADGGIYTDGQPINFWFNREIYIFGGTTPMTSADLESNIRFTNSLLEDVTFSVSVEANRVTITPLESLIANETYTINLNTSIYDRDNNYATSFPLQFQIDTNEPSFDITPANNQVIEERSFRLKANEPIFNSDGSVIQDTDIDAIVTVKLDDENGALVPVSGLFAGNTFHIKITDPIADQTYHVAVNNVEDLSGNELTSAETFTILSPAGLSLTSDPANGGVLGKRLFSISSDQELYDLDDTPLTSEDLASKLTLKKNDMNGTDVSFDAFIEGNSIYIATNQLTSASNYWVSLKEIEDITGIEIAQQEFTFTTSDLFNPVSGSGHAVSLAGGQIDMTSIDITGNFTLEAWVKTTDAEGMLIGNAFPSNLGFGVESGKLSFNTGGQNVISSASINDGTLHHVAMTYTSGAINLYIDGVLDGTGNVTEASTRTITVLGNGYMGNNPSQLTADIDEVRIWNTALNATDIATYQSISLDEAHPNISDLRALFAFDESRGQYALDYNGSLVKGILSGVYSWKTSDVVFPAAQFELSVDGQVIAFDGTYDLGSVVLNQSSAPKTFQIENTGTSELLLRGNPFVSIAGSGAAQFTVDESNTVSLLAPGTTATFTVTYTPTVAGLTQAGLIIENGSINDPFKLSLKGTGLDISTSGNWQLLRGRPGAFHVDGGGLAVYNGELYITSVASDGSQSGLFKFEGEELVHLGNSVRFPYLYVSSGGTFYSTTRQTGTYIYSAVSNGQSYTSGTPVLIPNLPSGGYTSYMGTFDMAFDSQDNAYVVYAANFIEPESFSAATGGVYIKKIVQGGVGLSDYAQLATQELKPNNYFGNQNIYSFDIAIDGNDNLWVVSRADQYDLFLSKYNDANDSWTHYDLTSHLIGTYPSGNLQIAIDEDDNIHIADKVQYDNKLKYLKVSSNGTVLVSTQYEASIKSSDVRFAMATGIDNNPIIIYVDEATNRFRAIKYENGAFTNFRDTYVTTDNESGNGYFNFTIDPTTGKAYLGYQSGTIYGKSIVTTTEIVPELTISLAGKQVKSGSPIALHSGVGYEKAIVLSISNEGKSVVNFSGPPTLTGANSEDLEIDLENLPASLFPGDTVNVPIRFIPVGAYESEATLTFPSNATGSGGEVKFQLKGIDDTNSGHWSLYSYINSSPMNSIDMTLYNGKPIWVVNSPRYKGGFQNPNRGNQWETLYYVELQLFDANSNSPISRRDRNGNNVNATPQLDWSEYNLNYFQNLNIEIDPSLGIPTVMANSTNTFSSYIPNETGGFESLTREGYLGFGDLIFDDDGEPYVMRAESGGVIIRKASYNYRYVVSISGLSNSNTDMDLEYFEDDLYFVYGDNTSLSVRRIAKDAATNSGMTTLLTTSDVRFSQSTQSKTKDLEFSKDGQLYLAYIINSSGNVAFKTFDELNSSWIDLPTLDLSSILSSANDIHDIQLEIHPDGSPYISIVYNYSATYGLSIVYRLENNVWSQQSTANLFTYPGTTISDTPLGHVATLEPIVKKSVLEISDEGTIYWLAGTEIRTMTPTPEAFDKAPSFTSTPSSSPVEEAASYSYAIVVADEDSEDQITITATNLPSWLTFTDNGDRTATLAGTPADEDVAEYTITLEASDGRITITQEVAIEVTNVNDDPDFFIEEGIFYIDQNNQGKTIEITGITDGDEGIEQNLTFSIISDNTALISNQVINYTAGESTATLDFSHNQAEHGDANLTVRLEDEGGLFKEQVVRINVVEGYVYLARSEPSGLYDEDIAIGTEIGTLFATDVDFDETYTFSLVSGLGDNFNHLFTIIDNTVFTAAVLDYETVSTPSFRFQGDNGEGTVYENFAVISLRDVNDAPTDFALSNLSIDEGLALGTTVGTFSATDQDSENTHDYTLVDGFGDNASFQIVGDELQVAEVFDFDDRSSYSIQVELDDSGLTLTRDFTISINNINVAPSGITISNASTPENGFADVLIGTLSTVDTDDEYTHTYAIVGGTTSLENDDVKLIGNQLYTNRSFDFEVEPEISVEIRSTDNGQESVTQTLIIAIEDANDVPTGIELSANTVEENVEVGSVIATISVLDPDINDTHTLSLSQGYEQNYAVSIDGLNIVSAIPLDYEILQSLALRLLVEDAAGGLNQFDVIVDVADVNEAPTDIIAPNTSIDENAQYGTVIGSLSTIDQDANNTHTYKVLTYTEVDGVKTFDVLVEENTVVVANLIDYETTPSLTIDIEVIDQGGLSFVKTFEFTVNDVNERPGEPTLSNQIIAENSPIGSLVGQLSSEDPDAGDELTFSLNSEYGGGNLFEIVGDQLLTAGDLDFEFWNDPEIKIAVTDREGLSSEKYFTISIQNINDAPTAITLSKSDIDEDALPGSVIGTLTTTDQDAGDTHTYEVLTPFVVDGQTFFPIIADGSNLVTTVPLDYETIPVFEIEVKSTDAQGLSFTETFTLIANDVNDAPTALELSATHISENTAIGTVVGILTTSDQDAGDTHTYNLETGFGDNEAFMISGAELKTNLAIDFETKSSYSIKIRTEDGQGASLSKEFTIEVTDVNDAPTAINLSGTSIDENAAAGTVIGSLTAVDQDANATHTFSLVSGFGDNASFAIAGTDLSNAAIFDFETKATYSIKVIADDGEGGVFEQEFTIDVNDVTEGEPQTITFDVLPEKTFGDAPFELTATASSGLAVSYTSSNDAIATVSGTTVTILGAGEVTITASQAGSEGTFEAANPVSQPLIINKADQTITFEALSDQVAGADPITLIASASSGLDVSFTATGAGSVEGNVLTLVGTGEVIVTATQMGNNNYHPAENVVQSFVVKDPTKADQVITFNLPEQVYVTDEAVELEATSDSELEVTFDIISGDEFVSRSGNVLNLVSAGTVVISASQAGNETFNPASVIMTMVIKPVFTVSGSVTDANGADFTAGTVALINSGQTTGAMTTLDATGNYQFTDIKDGIYYIGVIPDDPTAYYVTAYGNAVIYANATSISLSADVSGIDIQMVAKPTENELTGDGVVTGRLIEDDGTGNRIAMGRILEGTPIEGASILLLRKSDDKILTEVFSDGNGDFMISGIPEGSFSIVINIPGVEGTVSSDIEVQQGTEVLMTAMVGEDGIVFTTEVIEALGVDEQEVTWKVYPNPVIDFVTVRLSEEVTSFTWSIIDMRGTTVSKGEVSNRNETTLDMRALSDGLYFMTITNDQGKTRRIKLSK